MARTLPKERLLPSLLDRLTDDDPINSAIRRQEKKIGKIEKSLTELLAKKKAGSEDPKTINRQKTDLLQQLELARAQYAVLSASVCSLKELRACVKRDLDWLLNAGQYAPQEDLEDYPDIAQSVLNYGMPDLTGKTASGFDLLDLQRILKQVILDFEPRIIRRTLQVRLIADETMFNHNALMFEIEGDLHAEPLPLHLHLRSEFELENGTVSVVDFQS